MRDSKIRRLFEWVRWPPPYDGPILAGRIDGFAYLIGWAITGFAMLMLTFVFQTLVNRKPDVDRDVYGYANDAFGNFHLIQIPRRVVVDRGPAKVAEVADPVAAGERGTTA